MKYLLDTNICIAFLSGRDLRLRDKIIASDPSNLYLCSVVKAELLYGAFKSQNRQKNQRLLDRLFDQLTSLSFDDQSAHTYGGLRLSLEHSGVVIGANDLMIASIAIAHGLTVVTRNQREFAMIPALTSMDW
jgi:tRNA(fMet)-specific endonuclease VapC